MVSFGAVTVLLALIAGVGLGWMVAYVVAIRPLVNGYVRLRYDGFRPEAPPPKPLMVPDPPVRFPRED